MIDAQLYQVLFCIVLALRDGISKRFKKNDNGKDQSILNWLKVWHLAGVLMYAGICCLIAISWQAAITGLLVRLAFFDIVYNIGAGLKLNYTGFTSFWDGIFKIGAITRLIIFSIALIAFNIFIL